MENRELRPDNRPGRALTGSDVRCYERPADGRSISAPSSGTAVKHGKLPVSSSSITDEWSSDSTPVDPAGGHRYRNSIKTCESRVVMDSADCSVTRGERALKWGIISGN